VVRRGFIGRHLMLKGWYVEKLLSGEKKATIRLGIVRPKYDEVIIHAGGRPVAKAKIKRVYYRRVRELSINEARLEGFNSREELLRELRRIYGDISDDEYVTILELEVVQRLDNLEPEHPYAGLQPVDVARIALRYVRDKLSEEEVKVLRNLTITGSIRKTAENLYGSPENRGEVRRVLRKALRLLSEAGILPATSKGEQGEESRES